MLSFCLIAFTEMLNWIRIQLSFEMAALANLTERGEKEVAFERGKKETTQTYH